MQREIRKCLRVLKFMTLWFQLLPSLYEQRNELINYSNSRQNSHVDIMLVNVCYTRFKHALHCRYPRSLFTQPKALLFIQSFLLNIL